MADKQHFSTIRRDFADATYDFALPFDLIVQLEEKRGCGPMPILDRLQSGLWHVGDVRETIRLGLIGGGMQPEKALAMVRSHVETRATLELVPLAYMILCKAITGAQEPQGGATAPTEASNGSDEAEAAK